MHPNEAQRIKTDKGKDMADILFKPLGKEWFVICTNMLHFIENSFLH